MTRTRFETMLICVATAMVGGCATISVESTFDPVEAAYVLEDGYNTIRGQAFLRQRGGGVVTCAGAEVSLVPASGYAKERIGKLYGTTQTSAIRSLNIFNSRIAEADPEYWRHTRTTQCGVDGDFEFRDVADGSYFVVTVVAWVVDNSFAPEGGSVMAPVSVADGEVVELVVPGARR